MASGPKAGSGSEVYLIDEFGKIPPTSITSLAGPKPGRAVASATNGGSAVVDVHGSLRQTATSEPTIELSIARLGRAPSGRTGSANVGNAIGSIFASGGSVVGVQNAVRASANVEGAELGLPVARLRVKRSNYDQVSDDADWVGQSENFYVDADWQLSAKPTGQSTGSWTFVDIPKLVVDKRNNVLYQVGLVKNATPTPDEYSVVVYKHDPKLNPVPGDASASDRWSYVAGVEDHDFVTYVGNSGFVPFSLAACFRGETLYIFVCGYKSSTTESTLYTMRLSGSSVVLDASTDDLAPVVTGSVPSFRGLAADADDGGFVVAISGDAYLVNGGSPTRVVQIARSPDGQQWTVGEDLRTADLVTLGEFAVVARPRGSVASVHFYGSSVGYAVTDVGEIYGTTDGGASWKKQKSPCESQGAFEGSLPLYCVRAVSATVAYACGAQGVVLKTTDAGNVWKAKRFANTFTEDGGSSYSSYYSGGGKRIDQNDLDLGTPATSINRILTSMAWSSATVGWVVGQGGIVYYTGDGGSTWTTVYDWKSYGWLTGVTIEGANEILVCGTSSTGRGYGPVFSEDSNVPIGDRNAHMARIPAANLAAVIGNVTYHTIPGVKDDPVVAMQKSGSGSGHTFALTLSGFVCKRTTANKWARVGTTNHHQKFVGWKTSYALNNTDALRVISDDCAIVFGNFIYKTVDGGDSWLILDKPTKHDGSGYFFDDDTGVTGDRNSIAYALNVANDRVYPDVLSLGGGRFLVSVANIDRGRVEIYLSEDRGRSWQLVDDALAFPEIPTADAYESTPQTSLTVDEYGQIIMCAGIGRGSTVAAPAAPSVVATNDGSSLPAGSYRWAITTRDTTTLEETSLSPFVELANQTPAFYATLTFTAAGTGRETRIYATEDEGRSFYYVATVGAAVTTYQHDDETLMESNGYVGPPEQHDGGRVCPDGSGRTWVGRQSPLLAFPLGKVATATETAEGMDSVNNTRYTKAFFGRLFSSILRDGRSTAAQSRMLIAREFGTNTPAHYPPIIGRPQYVGVDAAAVSIIGDAPPGDSWTIETDFDYPKHNFSIESPSVIVKAALADASSDWVATWDRQDAEVAAAMGSEATHFCGNGLALFNTNFWRCIVRVSVPDWDSATFPTSPADYVEFELFSTVQYVSALLAPTNTEAAKSIVRIANVDMTPDQYKPARGRVYYLNALSFGAAYRILGNEKDSLIVENTNNLLAGVGYVFGNRFFSMLNDGANVGGSGTGINLSNTAFRYFRLFRIIVPASSNAIFGSQPQIGTPIIGRFVGSTGKTATPNEVRRSLSQGYGWMPKPSTIEVTGPSGISSVRNMGTGQRFVLPYNAAKSWDRDFIENGFGDSLRQAFCFVMNSGSPDSAELVRMQDGAEHVNLAGDRFSTAYELVQVL